MYESCSQSSVNWGVYCDFIEIDIVMAYICVAGKEKWTSTTLFCVYDNCLRGARRF